MHPVKNGGITVELMRPVKNGGSTVELMRPVKNGGITSHFYKTRTQQGPLNENTSRRLQISSLTCAENAASYYSSVQAKILIGYTL